MTIQLFNYESNLVRVIEINNESWFLLMDIAEVLEYSSADKLTNLLDKDEYTTVNPKDYSELAESLPANAFRVSVISESGIYHAVFKSNKPEANNFRKWITSEVLPSIRKTGAYVSSDINQSQLANLLQTLITKIDEQDIKITKITEENDNTVKYLTETNKEKDNQIKEFTDEQTKLNTVFKSYPGLDKAIAYFKDNINDDDQIYFTLRKYVTDKNITLSHGDKICVSRLVNGWLKVSGNFELGKSSSNNLLFQNKHILLLDLAIKNVLGLIC